MATEKSVMKRIPTNIVKLVEDEQRPRETFGEALARLIEARKARRGTGQEAQRKAS